jgi:PAS domain-containing protein
VWFYRSHQHDPRQNIEANLATILIIGLTLLLLLILGVLAVVVRHERQCHQRLAAELRLQASALRAAANAIVITNKTGDVVWSNPAFTTLTGYPAEEILGQNMRLIKGGWLDTAFYRQTWATITPVTNDRGAITNFIAIKQDVTLRTQRSDELREAAQLAQQKTALLESIMASPIGIIIFALDRNYCYTEFTPAHRATIKRIWSREIFIGLNMLEVITDPADRAKAKANFDRALKSEHLLLVEEYGDATQLRKFYENRYSPIIAANGAITGLTVFVTDVTARRLATAQP